MLGWIFPLLLICWLAAVLLERRVRRCAMELRSPAREQLTAIIGDHSTPATLMKSILGRDLHAVADAEFLRACAFYRASFILYVIVGAVTLIAVAFAFIAG